VRWLTSFTPLALVATILTLNRPRLGSLAIVRRVMFSPATCVVRRLEQMRSAASGGRRLDRST
jgi:hypothetical protein